VKLAILIAARNRPERVTALLASLEASIRVPHQVFVVEAGVEARQVSSHASLWYRDDEFRGKAFAHCLALEHARLCGEFDYVWILSPDLQFESDNDPAAALIALMEREPRMAIAAPTVRTRPRSNEGRGEFKPVATCESLGFIMRMSAVEQVGFLNPQFRYGWGAMDELAHRLYRAGWFLARAQGVGCHYLPTSTQGHDLSFDEYWRRARRFAFDYFRERHGEHWDELFWSATAGHAIEINAFREHKRLWSGGFTPSELLERSGGDVAPSIEAAPRTPERAPSTRREAPAIEAWPLATEAPYRLLAWPDYSDEGNLEQLFDGFARTLVGRTDACLCLRFDERVDGSEEHVVERLQQVFARVLGAQAPLEVLLVDDALEREDLPRLGAAVVGYARLPSSARSARREFLEATCASELSGGDALRLRLDCLGNPSYGRDVLDRVDFQLVSRIQELHPWAADCVIGNLCVRPGHGTARSAQSIQKQVERRTKCIVAPIARDFELRGARVLELGAGFGHFSAHMVAHGAAQIVMLEARERERRQAELYWSVNAFLPREDWQVLPAALCDPATWERIAQWPAFDLVMWTHALDSGVDVADKLRVLARATSRLLVIDLSRTDDGPVDGELEPRLISGLRELGFELESGTWTPPGSGGEEQALRSVLFAHKPKLVHVTAAALPQRAPKGESPPRRTVEHERQTLR